MVATKLSRISLALCLLSSVALAETLPEERLDLMLHSYNGGGMDINGPSLLIRTTLFDEVSVAFNYYEDHVSSASVDVESYASPYSEDREEESLKLEYLHNDTRLSGGFTRSDESDYLANTWYFALSQNFFGNLSTLSLGFSRGDDEVSRNGDVGFAETVSRQNFRISFSQIVSKNLVMVTEVETITDDGFLNNPYRQVRYLDEQAARGYSLQAERYPQTRNSDAFALRAMYYLPWQDSLRLQTGLFQDSWGINAQHYEMRYMHPWDENLLLEAKFRHYSQEKADFYADLYPQFDAQNFLGRDKELATFSSNTLGLGASYEWKNLKFAIFNRLSANIYVDYMRFSYDDYRDIRDSTALGAEPLYEFDAVVTRLYASLWF